MSSKTQPQKSSLYPEIIETDPTTPFSSATSSSSNLYPSIDMTDLHENLFPELHPSSVLVSPPLPPPQSDSLEELLIQIPGAILNLIDKNYSVELASGDFSVVRLRQGDNLVAILSRVGDETQWPLAKDEPSVKLDDSHYFFSLRLPPDGPHSDSEEEGEEEDSKTKTQIKNGSNDSEDILNYGLTIACKGQEGLIKEFDAILKEYSSFSVRKVSVSDKVESFIRKGDVSVAELEEEKEVVEGECVAYWTALAPNVEDYSGTAAKLIAAGSGQLVKGILWCGDVTMERLKWGNEVMKKRMGPASSSEISPETLKRIKRVKRMTKMTEKVANGVLCGVVKVSGFFTGSVANSKVGKKFFGLIPGEIILASLDGFNKVCDAVEVAGRNVMSTSSTVTTELVSHRYGEEAAKATNEGLDAAGHAIGTAWAAFKIRKALNPKGVVKPSALAKSAAAEMKSKKSK